ncbi:aminopeptidase [Escherichia coli]
MDLSLFKALSEADAIASSEQEVRQICWKKRIACKKKCDLMGWDRC